MASELSNLGLSIHYRILGILRQTGWFIEFKDQVLTPYTSSDVPANTFWNNELHPWVFMDQNSLPTPNNVVVKVAGTVVPPDQYRVNYNNGTVSFNTAPAGSVTCSFLRSAVVVLEGYPEDDILEQLELPAVAWFVARTEGKNFAIGSAAQDRTSFCSIDVLATNGSERTDLTDNLYRAIAYLPLYNLGNTQMLNDFGDVNLDFNNNTQFMGMARMSERPRASNLFPRRGGSTKEKFRGLIAFEAERVN